MPTDPIARIRARLDDVAGSYDPGSDWPHAFWLAVGDAQALLAELDRRQAAEQVERIGQEASEPSTEKQS